MEPTNIYEVLHNLAPGNPTFARFATLAEAEAFAAGKTFNDGPAWIRTRPIAPGSEALWDVA